MSESKGPSEESEGPPEASERPPEALKGPPEVSEGSSYIISETYKQHNRFEIILWNYKGEWRHFNNPMKQN